MKTKQEIILRHYWEGQSQRKISKALGVGRRTVRKYIEEYGAARRSLAEASEEQPIGLLLCTGGATMHRSNCCKLDTTYVKVDRYLTDELPKDLLKRKLHQLFIASKRQLAHRNP